MIQKYIDCLYNELIANIDTAHKKKVIFILLKTGKVDTVKLIPGWKNIIKTISAQEMFSYIAISLVRNDYLLNSIKFLIEECSYRFENIRDEGNNNLLHEACLYNSFNIAKYLLDHGFDPNKKNILGQTPLHNAIHTDNKMLVTLLVSKKANLNTQDNQKLTPLHVAALYNKNEVKLELIKLKADRSLKEKNGLTYLDLSKMVQKGEIKVASHITSEINHKKIEGLQKNSTLALFYETLLDKKIGAIENNFTRIRSLLENNDFLGKKQEIITYILLSCFLISKSFKPESLKIYSNFLIKKYSLPIEHIVLSYLKICNNLQIIGGHENIEQLLDEVVNFINTIEHSNPSFPIYGLYNDTCSIYYNCGLFEKAIKIGQLGLEYTSPGDHNYIKGLLFYNMGRSYFYLLRLDDAYLYFQRAFSLIKNDIDIFNSYFTSLINLNKLDMAQKIISELELKKYHEIYTIYIKYHKGELPEESALEQVSHKKFKKDRRLYSIALNIQSMCAHKLGNHKLTLTCMEKTFDIAVKEKNLTISLPIIEYLISSIIYNLSEEGLEFIHRTKELYPETYKTNLLVKRTELLVYIYNSKIEEAAKLISELSKYNIDYLIKESLYFECISLFLSQPDENKHEIALKLIDEILAINPSNLAAQFYKFLALVVIGRNTEANKIVGIDKDIVQQFAQEEGLLRIETAPEEEVKAEAEIEAEAEASVEQKTGVELNYTFNAEDFDPKKIHKYFQKEKNSLVINTARHISGQQENIISWAIPSSNRCVIYSTSFKEVTQVGSKLFSNYYCMIDSKLASQLDEKTLKQFLNALEKGVCNRAYGQNGIKFIKDGPIELKIKGDLRIYTTEVYINEDDNKLIIFDKVGNHEAIKNAGARQEINVSNLSLNKGPEQQDDVQGFVGKVSLSSRENAERFNHLI